MWVVESIFGFDLMLLMFLGPVSITWKSKLERHTSMPSLGFGSGSYPSPEIPLSGVSAVVTEDTHS
jgi:hypothetical protein